VQLVQEAGDCDFRLQFIDLSHEQRAYGEALDIATQMALTPFDLRTGPVIRAALIRTGNDKYIFAQAVHHIVFDGWSVGVEMEELLALYRKYNGETTAQLKPLSIQYKDYAAWEQEQLQGAKLAMHRSYWAGRFENLPRTLDFPYDRPRPAYKTYNGAVLNLVMDSAMSEGMDRLAKTSNASLFMVAMACIKSLLYRYTGQHDVVAGVPFTNRHHNQLEGQIGFYVNTLPIRTAFDPSTGFTALLEQVRQNILHAYDHGVYPFDRIIEDLQLPADVSRSPLFDVMIQMQEPGILSPDNELLPSGWNISPVDAHKGTSKFDLLFNIIPANGLVHIDIEYNTDLFESSTINNIKEELLKLVTLVLQDPFITPLDLRKQLAGTNQQSVNYTSSLVAEIEEEF